MNDMAHPEPHPQRPGGLSKAQKAAVILCLLDRDGAAPLFEELGEASIESFVRAMAQIGNIDGETVKSVVGEFISSLLIRGDTVHCGADAALEIIENNLGRAAAARIADSIDLFSGRNVWQRVAMVDPAVVSRYLEREHPQAAAAIMTKLPPEFAGRVLSEIEPEQARQIARYFRTTKGIGARSAEIIGGALGSFLVSSRMGASVLTPAERMAAIMNYASNQTRDALIEHIDELDPEFSEAVKRSMFTIADIEKRVTRTDVSKIVRAVESEVLVMALSGTDGLVQSVRNFFLSNISNRMSEMISQEIKEAGAIKRKDTEKAQAEVIKAIIALERAGEIELVRDDEE